MSKIRLFERVGTENYTPLAIEIEKEIAEAVRPILKKYKDQGVSIRDLQMVATEATATECLSVLYVYEQ